MSFRRILLPVLGWWLTKGSFYFTAILSGLAEPTCERHAARVNDDTIADLEHRFRETGSSADEAAWLEERIRIGELREFLLLPKGLLRDLSHELDLSRRDPALELAERALERGGEILVAEVERGVRNPDPVDFLFPARLAQVVGIRPSATGGKRLRIEEKGEEVEVAGFLERDPPFAVGGYLLGGGESREEEALERLVRDLKTTLPLLDSLTEIGRRVVSSPPIVPSPASEDDLVAAEAQIGFALPVPLRKVLRQVANGGFGPGHGLAGVGEQGHRAGTFAGHGRDSLEDGYLNCLAAGSRSPDWDWPDGLLPLVDKGCGTYVCLAANHPGQPVIELCFDGLEEEGVSVGDMLGDLLADDLRVPIEAFVEWLSAWLRTEQRWL